MCPAHCYRSHALPLGTQTFQRETVMKLKTLLLSAAAIGNTSTGLTVGALSGAGTSASVSATGAGSTVSVASLNSAGVVGSISK